MEVPVPVATPLPPEPPLVYEVTDLFQLHIHGNTRKFWAWCTANEIVPIVNNWGITDNEFYGLFPIKDKERILNWLKTQE